MAEATELISDEIDWQPLMDGEAVLLTANRRLAREWQRRYDQRHLVVVGARVWPTPPIHTWHDWLEQIWRRLAPQIPILTASAEQLLWRRIIAEDLDRRRLALFDRDALAEQAAEAYRRMQLYGGDWRQLAGEGEEPEALLRWRNALNDLLRDRALPVVLAADLPQQLLLRLSASKLQLPAALWLAGFDRLPPAEEQLLSRLSAMGCASRRVADGNRPAEVQLIAAVDSEQELRRAAGRIRSLLAEGVERIGVLLPDLSSRRTTLLRIFAEELHPVAAGEAHSASMPFNLSLGSPIAEQPAIALLLRLLELPASRSIESELLGQLLLSPHLAGFEAEGAVRARLDVVRCERNIATFSAPDLLRWPLLAQSPRFQSILQALLGDSSRFSGRRDVAHWCEQLQVVLAVSGIADGSELAALAATVDELIRMGPWLGELDWPEFVDEVARLCRSRIYRPDPSRAMVEVMGLLEAGGMQFDRLLLLGMGESWPAAAAPHPLLPLPLQIACDMPHASAKRELQFARELWQRVVGSAPTVEVSFAETVDGMPQLPSPLLRLLPLCRAEMSAAFSWRSVVSPSALEINPREPLPLLPQEHPSGGSALLKSQSCCAFQAFARHRLHLQPVESPQPGLNARERGSLLHAALERIWGELRDRAGLLALLADEERLQARLAAAVRAAWSAVERRVVPLPQRRLESHRLHDLLRDWLTVEAERPDFCVVQREWPCTLHLPLAGERILPLRLRIDRIDRDADGNLLLLDYKSGVVSAASLLGERMQEPQLPLYGQLPHWSADPLPDALQAVPAAIAFAVLRRDGSQFTGYAAADGLLPKVRGWESKWWRQEGEAPADWSALLGRWQQSLLALAEAFAAGEAAAAPRKSGDCSSCGMQMLCRIESQPAQEVVDE